MGEKFTFDPFLCRSAVHRYRDDVLERWVLLRRRKRSPSDWGWRRIAQETCGPLNAAWASARKHQLRRYPWPLSGNPCQPRFFDSHG